MAFQLEQRLFKAGFRTYVLDGDNIRQGLSADLEFSPADRSANIRRVGEVAALFAAAGLGVITAFISPYRSDRAGARKPVKGNFHEIYLSAGLVVCEKRDPKGLYKKARRGEISKFTRVTAPCEAPASPKLTIDTSAITVK